MMFAREEPLPEQNHTSLASFGGIGINDMLFVRNQTVGVIVLEHSSLQASVRVDADWNHLPAILFDISHSSLKPNYLNNVNLILCKIFNLFDTIFLTKMR